MLNPHGETPMNTMSPCGDHTIDELKYKDKLSIKDVYIEEDLGVVYSESSHNILMAPIVIYLSHILIFQETMFSYFCFSLSKNPYIFWPSQITWAIVIYFNLPLCRH